MFQRRLFRTVARSVDSRRGTIPGPRPPALLACVFLQLRAESSFKACVLSCIRTLIFVQPRWKRIWLCYQFCLMLAERNHGHPSRRGYAPGASSPNTTAEISNRWPLMMFDNLCNSPRGLIECVSAILSQKGKFSHVVMPRLLHVALLMTFTPEPLSTMHPAISVPCTSTLIVGFWWSIIVGALEDSVKCAEIVVSDVSN